MVVGIFGESCTGKSTLAEKITACLPCEIFTGKDYLRIAKNENIAKSLFQKKLAAAVNGDNIIYVISEMEHLPLLPEGAIRILVTADLELIKDRFTRRMRGNLPAPVANMLEKKHGCFDAQPHDIHVISGETDMDAVADRVAQMCAPKLRVEFWDSMEDPLLRFAVIISRYQGKWVYCRHKERNTYEIPGGHREPGESILDTAKRELREETGAETFDIHPVCVYSVTGKNRVNSTGETSYGMLYAAEIFSFAEELHSEMEAVFFFDAMPEDLTYPQIQPLLMQEYHRRLVP